MELSRRDLAILLAASGAASAQSPVLPSKVYLYPDLPVKKNPTNRSRNVLEGSTHTGYPIDMHETELDPGQPPHPPHHHTHEELLILRDGEVEVTVSGKSTKLSPGSVAYIASNEEHGWRNTGKTIARYYIVTFGRERKPE